MIQPNELRIGNWYNEFGIPRIATPQLILRLYQIELAGKTAIDISPIPLTPEVLEKCGFDRKTPNLFSGFGIVVLFDSEGVKVGIHIFGEMYHTLKEGKVKCLHQIQNIVFDLSGEELNYTP